VKLRAGFVSDPATVMKHGGAHQRPIRPRLLEPLITPMRSKQPRELGMIVLGDHDDRAIRFVSDNHGRPSQSQAAFENNTCVPMLTILLDPRPEGEPRSSAAHERQYFRLRRSTVPNAAPAKLTEASIAIMQA